MTINYLVDFKEETESLVKYNLPSTLFTNINMDTNVKILTLENTIISKEIELIDKNYSKISIQNCELIILTEPQYNNIDLETFTEFFNKYEEFVEESKTKNIPIIHIVTNPKWYSAFSTFVEKNGIKLFTTQSLQEDLNLPDDKLVNIKEYTSISKLYNYSNEINDSILLDLTKGHATDYHYKLNIGRLLEKVKQFSKIDIVINNESFIPKITDEKINIYNQEEYDWNNLENITYVYYHSNDPYSMSDVDKILFYALNSKVIYTNYNYYINNLLPSVIMNLSKKNYIIEKLPKKEALDILNENRNTVLFNNTSINVINDISNLILNQQYIKSYSLSNYLQDFTEDMYLKCNKGAHKINLDVKSNKYDIEKTLILPIIFLGENIVQYGLSKASLTEKGKKLIIPLYTEKKHVESKNDKILSMIVPIHNNGRYLKYKCFNSILRLTCLDQIEIIFIDDGSTDVGTIRIIQDLREDYPGIIYKKFDHGSGSASRPRNVGMKIASCKYITFLDPDNEAIEDGYTVLLNELTENEDLDMVVANIVREDNIKRNDISYYNKVMKVRDNPYIKNMKKLLLDTNLSVQSIQALIVKKKIIDENQLKMIEGAAGQDTLFFQELLLKCSYVKVIDKNVHSYYAFVDGSVTNTVSHKFFEKFYKVETERKKFLEEENLIDFYMDIRFNSYMKNWYYSKLKQVNSPEEKWLAKQTILKVFDLYDNYKQYYNNDTMFIKNDIVSN